MYGARGWVAHGYTDQWLDLLPKGGPQWSLCPSCGAWAALHMWEAWLFGRDARFLREDAYVEQTRVSDVSVLQYHTPDWERKGPVIFNC